VSRDRGPPCAGFGPCLHMPGAQARCFRPRSTPGVPVRTLNRLDACACVSLSCALARALRLQN